MKNLFNPMRAAALALTLPLLLSSCATVTSLDGGISPTITLTSPVTDPVNISTSKDFYENVYFPVKVKVKRHHLNGQRIRISSPKWEFDDIVMRAQLNGWVFGNIFIGGLVGLGVDLGTGCVVAPVQTEFNVYPKEKREVHNTVADSVSVQPTNPAPAENQ